ncbi:MAG TPA: 4-alpha-glucanotransferase, partial [Acidimicrobiales bacterium]|nr:4-alpha-glucanotransferase [Acidimicrobiales bacterium]
WVDHVLGWSRLWWIPAGMPASAGAYVHYHLEELLAVACLESWRHGSRLIGEDLGTVEPALQRALRRHDVAGMRVAVFDLDASPDTPLSPPKTTVAYVDTHDTATFAGFLGGSEIDLRASLGLLGPAAARTARARRAGVRRAIEGRLLGKRPRRGEQPALAVLAALLEELGRSEAELVLVNLEDLWAEVDPHNVPGTTTEHANFARRLRRSTEDLACDGELLAVLGRLDAARRDRREKSEQEVSRGRRGGHDRAEPLAVRGMPTRGRDRG